MMDICRISVCLFCLSVFLDAEKTVDERKMVKTKLKRRADRRPGKTFTNTTDIRHQTHGNGTDDDYSENVDVPDFISDVSDIHPNITSTRVEETTREDNCNNSSTCSPHCPTAECQCWTLHGTNEAAMRCTHVMKTLPFFRFVSVTFSSIIMSRLNLSHVATGSLRNIRTKALDLSGNELSRNGIEGGAFRGLEFILKVLSLSDCGLRKVPSAVSHLLQLTVLHMDGNRLQNLKKSAFGINSKLRELYLQRNKLKQIDPDSFSGLHQLRELRLSYNKLWQVDSQLFEPLSRLITLDLSHNLIFSLSPGTFKPLKSLQWLQLKANLIHFVTREMFFGLDVIGSLQLDHNPLLEIEEETFEGMRKLHFLSLDLHNNTTITGDILRGFGRLQTLSFGSITGTTLPSGLFENMRSLSHLSIQDSTGFGGFTLDLFKPGMNFSQLSIIAGVIPHCRCSTGWIRDLVERGASVSGSCGYNQLVTCSLSQL